MKLAICALKGAVIVVSDFEEDIGVGLTLDDLWFKSHMFELYLDCLFAPFLHNAVKLFESNKFYNTITRNTLSAVGRCLCSCSG